MSNKINKMIENKLLFDAKHEMKKSDEKINEIKKLIQSKENKAPFF